MSARSALTPPAGTAVAATATLAMAATDTMISATAATSAADVPAVVHSPRPIHITAETSSPALDADPTAVTQPPCAVVRARLLSDAVRQHLIRGAVVESMTAYRVVLRHRRPANHRCHALGTALTLGAWAPLWALTTAINATRRDVLILSVDEHGTITTEAPPPAPTSHGGN